MPHAAMAERVESDQDEVARRQLPWGTIALAILLLLGLGGGLLGHVEIAMLVVATIVACALLLPGIRSSVVREVKVRCAACRGLNDEHARYCSSCGKPV